MPRMHPAAALLGTLVAIVAAIAVVVVVRRRRTAIDIGPATGFVAGAYALVVSLLLVAVITHFDEARYAVLDEVTTSAAVFENAESFPAAQRIAVQHDVVCLLRSTINEEWPGVASGNLNGAATTWQRQWRLNATLAAIGNTPTGQLETYSQASAKLEERNEARIKRLYEGQTLMSTAHWIVLWAGAFLVIVLLGLELNIRDKPVWFGIFGMLIVSITILLAAIALIDTPYRGVWRVTPKPMEAALTVMRGMPGSNEAFRPCEPIPAVQ